MQQYIKIFFLEQDRKIIAYVLNRVTQGTSSPNFHFLYPNSSSLPCFSTGGNQGGEGGRVLILFYACHVYQEQHFTCYEYEREN